MSNEEMILTAVIYSAAEPSESQKARFGQFLKKKYGAEVPLKWEKSDAFPGGFRLEGRNPTRSREASDSKSVPTFTTGQSAEDSAS